MSKLIFKRINDVFIFESGDPPGSRTEKRAGDLVRLIHKICPDLVAGYHRDFTVWVGPRDGGRHERKTMNPGDIIMARGGTFLFVTQEGMRALAGACRDFAGFLGRHDRETLVSVVWDGMDGMRRDDAEAVTRAAGRYIPVRDMETIVEKLRLLRRAGRKKNNGDCD